jgi:hypothetical protein
MTTMPDHSLITTPLFLLLALAASAATDGKPEPNTRLRGRLAYSCDGNHNDPDDWAASPVTLAILAEAGLKDRLVHFDYNSILTLTDADYEAKHTASVLGAAEHYGFNRSLFHDCRKELDAAVASLAKAVNDSTAENPLCFIIAGPVEVPCLGLQKADPAKRRFVYCISHSRWNDGFASNYRFTHTKRSVIEQDVHWVQIRDQNRLLSLSPYKRPAKPEEFAGFFWMRDSHDPKVRFLWERMLVSTRPDPSDAGMTYFLVSGDEDCDPVKLKKLIEDHQPPTVVRARKQVRLEAENFRHLDGCILEDRKDKRASQELNTRLALGSAQARSGRIRTAFDEPFTPGRARYDVEIRYLDEKDSPTRLAFFLDGKAQGAPWQTKGEGRGWTSHTIRDVEISAGNEIRVDIDGLPGRLDYVQLNWRGAPAWPSER